MEPEEPKEPQPPKKRERRRAPPYTLVWSEEVRAHPSITTKDVLVLRKRVLLLIAAAEAALNDDPSVFKLGVSAKINDILWAKFKVGKNWFSVELEHKKIREYVVKLASPPSPDDILPPPGRRMRNGANGQAHTEKSNQSQDKKDGEGTESALLRSDHWIRAITVVSRFTPRNLNRSWALAKSRVRTNLYEIVHYARRVYDNVSYNMRGFDALRDKLLRRFASTIASGRISFTRMRELPIQRVTAEARLEPRWVSQNSGLHVLLYSWIRDEQQPIDWSADLFGVSPIPWAANLFGVVPEEERAVR